MSPSAQLKMNGLTSLDLDHRWRCLQGCRLAHHRHRNLRANPPQGILAAGCKAHGLGSGQALLLTYPVTQGETYPL